MAHSQAVSLKTIAPASVRRHFIIAYDISTPFLKAVAAAPSFTDAVIARFEKAPRAQFDPALDEISFFHFGIAREEFDPLRWADRYGTDDEKLALFMDKFLKNKELYWSEYYAQKKTIADYFRDAFNHVPNPPHFGPGISLSNYVYPLVMDKLAGTYAEDYVLLVLSDFLTGSDFGNKKDFERILELYQYRATSTPALIKTYTDRLSAGFYKVESFDFDCTSPGFTTGALAWVVKPNIGSQRPEAYSLFVDGNLHIAQQGYKSEWFRLSPLEINFTHNKQFEPRRLRLRVLEGVGGANRVMMDTLIAEKMPYDSQKHTYALSAMDLHLPPIAAGDAFDKLALEYTIEGDYTVMDGSRLGYRYATGRTINKDQVSFTSSTPRIIMYTVIPAAVLILAVWLLARLGRPKGLQLELNGYTDSYELLDYQRQERLRTPYKAWNEAKSVIPCTLQVNYALPGYLLNWKPVVRLRIDPQSVPPGFDVYLKQNQVSTSEFYADNPLSLRVPGGKKTLSFITELRQNSGFHELTAPELVTIKLVALISERRLLKTVKSVHELVVPYAFHIGPYLGDTWMGFDPGTTGSCVAAGNLSENILLGQLGKKKKEIEDSKIILDTTLPYTADPALDTIPEKYYKYGQETEGEFGNDNVMSFQSIKKLLGFRNIRRVRFSNGVTLEFTGKKLSTLLVASLYRDYKKFAEENPSRAKEILKDGRFNPSRAVVAVPNNFTFSKIKDILDCYKGLAQFREIRYVYEAEAVLFYYLYNYRRFNKSETAFAPENILVFDMGGATINVTVVNAQQVAATGKYAVNILGKLGYGIGGDTIDYCIIKSILAHKGDVPGLKIDDPFAKSDYMTDAERKRSSNMVIALQKMAFGIKKKIVQNYYDTAVQNLLMAAELDDILIKLQSDLKQRAGGIDIDPDSDVYAQFRKNDDKNRTHILQNEYFKKYIYNNVSEVTADIVDLCEGVAIDKVIFTGRSCTFPMIKEAVKDVLKQKGSKAVAVVFKDEEAKTAVAVGACWYGLNRNAIQLNNVQTNASFGIQRRRGIDQGELEYIELLAAAKAFNGAGGNGIKFLDSQVPIEDSFMHDNNTVNFYQVMGKNAVKILCENQNHKFSKIAAIPVDMVTELVQMRVYENDIVKCGVQLQSKERRRAEGTVSDQDIADANDEHYTWIIQ